MSGVSSDLINDFLAIVGESATADDAEKYLKMSKNNLEMALNYFFNKKQKHEKQAEPPKPLTAFQQLHEGSKKQAHIERIIKELKQDYAKPVLPSPGTSSINKSPDQLKVTPYPKPFIEKQSSTDSKGSASKMSVEKSSTERSFVRLESKTSAEKIGFTSTPEPTPLKLEKRFEQATGSGKSVKSAIGSMRDIIEEENDGLDLPLLTFPKVAVDCLENRSVGEMGTIDGTGFFERKVLSEPGEDQDLMDFLEEVKPNKLKRNFKEFEASHNPQKPNSTMNIPKAGYNQNSDPNAWPKFLGRAPIKASVLFSGQQKMKEGDAVYLRREKQILVNNNKKKGFKNQAQSTNPTIVRVLYRDEEIGKLENDFAYMLAPLLDKNYIYVEAKVKTPPSTWSTFASFWIDVEVFLAEAAVSKPLTEVFSLKENVKTEEEHILIEMQSTKEAFVSLFDLIRLNRVTDTLIKRMPSKYSKSSYNSDQKSQKSSEATKQESKIDIFDPFQRAPKQKSIAEFATKGSRENSSSLPLTMMDDAALAQSQREEVIKDHSSDVNYEKLLNLEDDDTSELKLSEPCDLFASTLHPYQKQALTWMLSREGVNEKAFLRLNDKIRVLHPLWEEYELPDGTRIYFNPYTGQVSKELPKAAPDCLGGILADEMGLGKTVMMISLILTHRFEMNDTGIFKKAGEKKRKVTNSVTTPGLKPGGTLIVVPVTLLSQWEDEFEVHSVPNSVRVFVYYGNQRYFGKGDLGRYDVVLTTYGIISNEFIGNGNKELYKYEWFRVVLDEAHYIKGRTIQTAKAVYDLNAIHKWCLSGTPIQNKLDDLFSLIHFLKLEPWSDYVWWNTYINKPNEKNDPVVFQILQSILRPILLRRTKKTQSKDGKSIIELPEKVSKIEYITTNEDEKKVYEHLYTRGKKEFDRLLQEGSLISNYAHVFEILLRLRQCCDHPLLIYSRPDVQSKDKLEEAITAWIEKKEQEVAGRNDDDNEKDSPKDKLNKDHDHFEVVMDEPVPIKKSHTLYNKRFLKETIEKLKNEKLDNCPVCLNEVEDAVISICGHVLCRYCMIRAIEETSMCPICRNILTKKDFMTVPRDSRFSVDVDTQYKRSSKIDALMSHIFEVIAKKEKCVVFSQFIGMLSLIEHDLKKNNIEFLRLDGSLAQKKRADILEEFKKNNTIYVFLISLKAGGVGLNLTIANHAFLIDPWWNPAVEEQAVERVHRIGQKKNVEVVRFICKETIEERIIELHEQKRDLINNTVVYNQEERKLQNVENFKYLMKNYK